MQRLLQLLQYNVSSWYSRWHPSFARCLHLPYFGLQYDTPSDLVLDPSCGPAIHNDTPIRSETGVKQGGSESMNGCSLGLHPVLLQTSAYHPTTSVLAYADDAHCHHATSPREAFATNADMQLYADEYLKLTSVVTKGNFYAPGATDDELRLILDASMPGSPDFAGAPGVEAGRTHGFTCVGNFISLAGPWASDALLKESTKRARGVLNLPDIVDDKYESAFVCAMGLLRWCANEQPSAWLQGMQPSVTAAAAVAHDTRISTAFYRITRASRCTAAEFGLSIRQARLPTARFGGGSLFSAAQRAPAKFVSSVARAAASCRVNVPGFTGFKFASDCTPLMVEFRSCLDHINLQRDAVASDYADYDANFIDHTTYGDKTFQYHPSGLPTAAALPSPAALDDPASKFSCAQRHFAAVADHADWITLYRAARALCTRRAAFFISACQQGAGDFLNCLPATSRQPTDLARIAVQRRFRIRTESHHVAQATG